MAVPSWPAGIPSCLIGLAAPVWADGRLRSQTDTGPSKMRRRSSAMAGPMTGSLVMTYYQMQLLQDFVRTTTAGGSLPFSYPSPIGGPDMLVRFGESLPAWQRYGHKVSVEIQLEILPG